LVLATCKVALFYFGGHCDTVEVAIRC
jgi:hypothetical protein